MAYQVTEKDLYVVKEFMAKPIGHHSPDLQRVLNTLRGADVKGKHCLVCTSPAASGASPSSRACAASRSSCSTRPSTISRTPSATSSACAGSSTPARRCPNSRRQRLCARGPLHHRPPTARPWGRPHMTRIAGYSDRVSVTPGETINFMVSCEAPSYKCDIVRLICGDQNPGRPRRQGEGRPHRRERHLQGAPAGLLRRLLHGSPGPSRRSTAWRASLSRPSSGRRHRIAAPRR